MKKKKMISVLLTAVMAAGVLSACSTGQSSTQNGDNAPNTSAGGVTTIEFWAAPNPTQQAFWQT
ncbi:carbohydrate ABC transporter substrate-binding protein, partial [Paenibacillus sepulcri]|nr:carbohydrate ABC transporter substrate-binding protein [Paenibacillus sepulcri]